jgi:hypothetical protein
MHTFVVVLAIAIAPALAFAQPKDPKFEYGKAAEVEKVKTVEWDALAEAGMVFTTGNSKTTTVVGGFKAARKTGGNKLALEGSLTYAKSSVRVLAEGTDPADVTRDDILTVDSTTAETVFGKVRYDRFLTKHNSLFVAALGARDLPAGKELVFGGQVGYSRQLYKSKTDEAVAELGYDYSRENLVSGDPVSIHSVRGFLGYKALMTTGTTLDTSIEGLTNVNKETLVTRVEKVTFGEDTRINVRAAVSAKIGRNLAIQTSFEGKYDNRPAPLVIGGKPLMTNMMAPAFEASSFDTVLKVSLIYAFFAKPPVPPPPPCPACPKPPAKP